MDGIYICKIDETLGLIDGVDLQYRSCYEHCRSYWREDISWEVEIMCEIDQEPGSWDMLFEYFTIE